MKMSTPADPARPHAPSERKFSSGLTRRGFLGVAGVATLGAPSAVRGALSLPGGPRSPEDEAYWGLVQQAFRLDRTATYLNAAGVCPAPASVLDAVISDTEFTNRLPARHAWRVLEPRAEGAREALARAIGADAEEVALTRGATEAVEIAQLGLDLEPGDEVLTTDRDFFRMLNTWEQRAQRDGVRLTTIALPDAPTADEIVHIFSEALTPRTRVVLLCHVTNVAGLVLPVAEICRLARDRGIQTIVDGAQAFGHVPVDVHEMGCDYYGGSVHKYGLGPLGTGFLYVRRERIAGLWSLAPGRADRAADIRKFEDVGTHSAAPHNAVCEALRFTDSIGQVDVEARLRHLAGLAREALSSVAGVTAYRPSHPDLGSSIVTFGVEGIDPEDLTQALWSEHRIVVRAVRHPQFPGVRMSPHIYNTPEEVERVAHAVQESLDNLNR